MSSGVEATVIPKKYVKVQSAQPSNAVQGDLWVDSDNNILYQYTGSAWQEITQDVGYIDTAIAQLSLSVVALQADASVTPNDYDNLFVDTFSDSSGYDNTIDTGGSTTASFNSTTKKYENSTTSGSAETYNSPASTGTGNNSWSGVKITPSANCTLTGFTVYTGGTDQTQYRIGTSATGSEVGSGSLTGSPGTISGLSHNLTSGTAYWIETSTGGSSSHRYKGSPSFPLTATNFAINEGYADGTGDPHLRTIAQIVIAPQATTPANKVVQTNTITLPSDAVAYQLVCNKTLAGSGSLTYKISFDNGSNFSTAKNISEKYLNSTAGTSIKLQFLLNGVGSGNTSKMSDYALIVWY